MPPENVLIPPSAIIVSAPRPAVTDIEENPVNHNEFAMSPLGHSRDTGCGQNECASPSDGGARCGSIDCCGPPHGVAGHSDGGCRNLRPRSVWSGLCVLVPGYIFLFEATTQSLTQIGEGII